MASIKRRGVAAAGAAAGAVLVAGGVALAYLIDLPRLATAFEGHTPDLATPLALRFALGFVLVWVYVGFRPRFGGGSRAIAASTTAVWLAVSSGVVAAAALFPILPPLTVALVVVWGLIELALACMVGAAQYRRHVAALTRRRGRSVTPPPLTDRR
ncbi:MAG TPA: hypothetical protein VLA33_09025 [Gemmatimonadota bacterium]|nr:hypothetical protein [Gemmatimonadota bacterium]